MNQALINAEVLTLLSRLTGKTWEQQDVKPSLLFLVNLVIILMGVMFADGRAVDAEKQHLINILYQLCPENSEERKLAHLTIKQVQQQQLYWQLQELIALTAPFSASEKLLLVALGYEISTADGSIGDREQQYLHAVASSLAIDTRYLAVLEAGLQGKSCTDNQAIQKVSSLLVASNFSDLEFLTSAFIQQILSKLPIPDAGIFYSLEIDGTAAKLKNLISSCLVELDRAEDVWLSKPRIIAANKKDILEILGELSGCYLIIEKAGINYQKEVSQTADEYWQAKIEVLRKTWFVDSNNKPKQKIGWGDKEGFLKNLRSYLEKGLPLAEINTFIGNGLDALYQLLMKLDLKKIELALDLLDASSQAKYRQEFASLYQEIESDFDRSLLHFYSDSNIKNFLKQSLDNLGKAWGDITWDEVADFRDKITAEIQNAIATVFAAKIKMAKEVIDIHIAFYHRFLEQQERYQQETPEQRQAEKEWIDRQRQKFQQVQADIEIVLDRPSDRAEKFGT